MCVSECAQVNVCGNGVSACVESGGHFCCCFVLICGFDFKNVVCGGKMG